MGEASGGRRRVFDPASRDDDATGYFDPGMRIGTSLARLRLELIEAGGRLSEVFEPAGAGVVADAMRVLERQVCRVAVIGQIKAGKSCFINGLVQWPDLLPTDVNPWTTATTHLHLHPRPEGEDAATFHFFAESEWEQLADGGGKLRELTERLDPGFEPELLRRHLSALKTRAANRLGPEFSRLLGQQHRFQALSRSTLRQYVCQGDPAGYGTADQSIGRYSDVTKAADIYLNSGPFDYPVTVIDTPGTNDPCLIRDEITRRALESADLYIVVLTARQPLSASDVALLRILRGLQKERFIIYLNRIDELSDIAADTELVLGAVEDWIRHEFADADIALVAGSAWWANCALASETANFDQMLGSRAINYLQRKGFFQREHQLRLAQSGEDASTSLRAALFAASGFNQVYMALDELMGRSHNASLMREMTASFSEMVRASARAAGEEIQSLARSRADTSTPAERWQRELSRLRDELQGLNEVSSIIATSGALFKERQMDIVSRELTALRNRLLAIVNECARIAKELQVDNASRAWTFDSNPLRRELAGVFIDGFQRAENQLLQLQQDVVPHLNRLLARLVPGAEAVMKTGMAHRPMRPPRMMSLGATLALDLDASWWSQLWKAWPAASQRGRALERLIVSEFGRVVEELVAACERSLTDHVVATTEWTFGICDNIARSISRRRERLVAYYENLQQEIEGTADPQTTSAQQQYVATFSEYLDKCEALARTLERIGREIEGVAEPETMWTQLRSHAKFNHHLDKGEAASGRVLGRIGLDPGRDVPGG
jgi:tRNA U34 5-carboxymethylaminomethyl modifying GTPase MnmE/TrmE/uncharacterized protein YukE